MICIFCRVNTYEFLFFLTFLFKLYFQAPFKMVQSYLLKYIFIGHSYNRSQIINLKCCQKPNLKQNPQNLSVIQNIQTKII